jgi:single-strand DNA-binding protein
LILQGFNTRSTEILRSYPTINRVVLVGRLTRDPALGRLRSGETVCGLRVACNSSRRLPDGRYEERPNYFDVDVLGTLGESVASKTPKGRRLAIDGSLEWREWKNSFGETREAVSVLADTVQFLDSTRGHRGGQRHLGLAGAGAGEATLVF